MRSYLSFNAVLVASMLLLGCEEHPFAATDEADPMIIAVAQGRVHLQVEQRRDFYSFKSRIATYLDRSELLIQFAAEVAEEEGEKRIQTTFALPITPDTAFPAPGEYIVTEGDAARYGLAFSAEDRSGTRTSLSFQVMEVRVRIEQVQYGTITGAFSVVGKQVSGRIMSWTGGRDLGLTGEKVKVSGRFESLEVYSRSSGQTEEEVLHPPFLD